MHKTKTLAIKWQINGKYFQPNILYFNNMHDQYGKRCALPIFLLFPARNNR